MVNEFGHIKRSRSSRREQRRAIKRAIPFQGFDALARRPSFGADMRGRGLGSYGQAVETQGHKGAAKVCVPFRLVTLVSDPAVRYLPETGAP